MLALFLLFLSLCQSSLSLCSGGAVARVLGDWIAPVWLSVVGDRVLYSLESPAVRQGSGLVNKRLHTHYNPLPYLSLPRASVAPNTLPAIPLLQLLPGCGQALISRVLQTATLVFSPNRGKRPPPAGPSWSWHQRTPKYLQGPDGPLQPSA